MKIPPNRTLFARSIGMLLFFLLMLNGISQAAATGFPGPAREDSTVTRQNSPKPTLWFRRNQPNIHELTVWGGHAFDSMKLWGKTPNSSMSQVGIGYNRKLLSIYNSLLEYRVGLNLFSQYNYPEFTLENNRISLSGFGMSPVGFQINFLRTGKIQPYLNTTAGFILFERPFPDERGTRFNYTFGAGTGLEIILYNHTSLSVGYRYYHLSNGESGLVNPGIDSNSIYFGLTLF